MNKMKSTTLTIIRKKVKHKVCEQIIELKDDRSLFARSRPEIDLVRAFEKYELTLSSGLFSTLMGCLYLVMMRGNLLNFWKASPRTMKLYDQGQKIAQMEREWLFWMVW